MHGWLARTGGVFAGGVEGKVVASLESAPLLVGKVMAEGRGDKDWRGCRCGDENSGCKLGERLLKGGLFFEANAVEGRTVDFPFLEKTLIDWEEYDLWSCKTWLGGRVHQ